MKYLVVMEVSQKQNYIFRTDRLAENIGASLIIRRITEELPPGFEHYTKNRSFMGGGKAVFQFPEKTDARKFTSEISETILRDYPGIELFMATQEYDETSDNVIETVDQLYSRLEKKKSERKESFRLYGLGITEQCSDTQLPAVVRRPVSYGTPPVYLSAESNSKLIESRDGQAEAFEDILPDGYKFAKQFEDLGASRGKKSYIAVISADGNRMGQKIKRFREAFMKKSQTMNRAEFNKLYLEKFAELSRKIDESYRESVKAALVELIDRIDQLKESGGITIKAGKENILPVRPLILSGDDICIVTDARLGINLAELLLKNIDKHGSFEFEGIPFEMHACAGIAMVHNHYPFFRAHELAEQLCSSAKTLISDPRDEDEPVIDWHIVQGEIEGSIGEIRSRKYQDLTMKPYYLNDGRDNSLCEFKKRMHTFSTVQVGRSIIKNYRDALSEGEDAVRQYWKYSRLSRKKIARKPRGLDFDVIEMLDIYKDMGE